MTDVVMESAEKLERKSVNDEGRLYLGQEYAGKEIEIAIKTVGGEDGSP